jgi:hypothetical protein
MLIFGYIVRAQHPSEIEIGLGRELSQSYIRTILNLHDSKCDLGYAFRVYALLAYMADSSVRALADRIDLSRAAMWSASWMNVNFVERVAPD